MSDPSSPRPDRRQFVSTTAAGATAVSLPAIQYRRLRGTHDSVRLGVIGVGNRGRQVSRAFLEHRDARIAAVCDVYQPYLDQAVSELPDQPAGHEDFRHLLDRDDIDAVLIATPDHWHALQTVMACRAGKDVYVEKPLSATIHEGRVMVRVARETERVVQVGTHRRSSPVWRKMIEMVRSGMLGKITVLQAYRTNNMSPAGIGKLPTTPPPRGLNWELWLGPRPLRDYQNNITPYKFRWWQNYSSQFGNWGVHYFDAMRWVLQEESPAAVCTLGGNFAIDDDRTIPDTAQSVFEFGSGCLALFGTYEAFGNPMLKAGEFEIRGSQGTLYVDRDGIHVLPEKKGQFQEQDPPGEAVDVPLKHNNHGDTVAHTRNFLDCIKSRQRPHADVEIGHRSTTMSHLANLALQVRARLQWDAEREHVIEPESANQQLHYEYRQPWTLE